MQELFLSEWFVVRDVEGLSLGAVVVSAEEKPLHNISHIDKRKGVAPGANNEALSGTQLVGHAPEIQTVTNSKNRTWSNDSCWQMIPIDHALYQQITLCLGNPVWVVAGRRWNFL
jgi:hypothetical protein